VLLTDKNSYGLTALSKMNCKKKTLENTGFSRVLVNCDILF